jgi:hypothetical protein
LLTGSEIILLIPNRNHPKWNLYRCQALALYKRTAEKGKMTKLINLIILIILMKQRT